MLDDQEELEEITHTKNLEKEVDKVLSEQLLHDDHGDTIIGSRDKPPTFSKK
ncbi:MAG: hypothetical protein S4CHLAM37_11390 [Chlamydiia bacterium]|nr:hypothetical protein [Chlamydiia bacterium]